MGSSGVNSIFSLLFCLIFVASGSVRAGDHGAAVSSIDELISSSLVVPQGNVVQQVLFGTGIQIYVYNSNAWVLHNVSADLYNSKGLKVGHQYFLGEEDSNGGQATWETYSPPTRVTGKILTSLYQEDAIEWLLLEATSNSGRKFFGLTTFVQRLYTQHGLPPSPQVSAKEGQIFASNYTSLYTFSSKEAS